MSGFHILYSEGMFKCFIPPNLLGFHLIFLSFQVYKMYISDKMVHVYWAENSYPQERKFGSYSQIGILAIWLARYPYN